MIERFKAIKRLKSRRAAHLELGARGERVAVGYLQDCEGYQVVATNFLVPVGRSLRGQKLTSEIDIIAYDGPTLAFIEVKTRTSDEIVAPQSAVDLRKKRQIARAARRYRQLMRVADEPFRYDVVTVIPEPEGYRVELLRNYFDDRVFQRARFFNNAQEW
jgi:putative endonuclease